MCLRYLLLLKQVTTTWRSLRTVYYAVSTNVQPSLRFFQRVWRSDFFTKRFCYYGMSKSERPLAILRLAIVKGPCWAISYTPHILATYSVSTIRKSTLFEGEAVGMLPLALAAASALSYRAGHTHGYISSCSFHHQTHHHRVHFTVLLTSTSPS